MKTHIACICACAVAVLMAVPAFSQEPIHCAIPVPEEPPLEGATGLAHTKVVSAYYNESNREQDAPDGIFVIAYDLDDDGIVEYKTGRHITEIKETPVPIQKYDKNRHEKYENPKDFFGITTEVITQEYPLFYWFRRKPNGPFELWIDGYTQIPDGLNCNEYLYTEIKAP